MCFTCGRVGHKSDSCWGVNVVGEGAGEQQQQDEQQIGRVCMIASVDGGEVT